MTALDGWAVAQCKPREEKRAVKHATLQGFECYFPRIRYKKPYRGRLVVQSEPLFPSYIFVRVVGVWRSLLGTLGISRVIMSSPEKPALLSDAFVENIKDNCVEGFYVPQKFRVGQAVRVDKGPLFGQVGVFYGMAPKERVWVLMSMLGSEIKVSVKENDLVAA